MRITLQVEGHLGFSYHKIHSTFTIWHTSDLKSAPPPQIDQNPSKTLYTSKNKISLLYHLHIARICHGNSDRSSVNTRKREGQRKGCFAAGKERCSMPALLLVLLMQWRHYYNDVTQAGAAALWVIMYTDRQTEKAKTLYPPVFTTFTLVMSGKVHSLALHGR